MPNPLQMASPSDPDRAANTLLEAEAAGGHAASPRAGRGQGVERKPPRLVLHADMDAFYASVEQREHPELRGKPVVVGAQSARGVVAAASYEARAYGVRSAMPGYRARELCPHAVFVRGDMELYARVSRQVHELFREFTPVIEPLALDEAFLDISGSVHLFGSAVELGYRLKRRVREVTQLPISVGIGPTKQVAKVACTLGKPDGLLVVPPQAVDWLLRPLPVGRLWGVGPVLQRKLEGAGIRTIAQLADHDPGWLAVLVGHDRARELLALARGQDHRQVEADRAPKSYGEENTFERDVSDRQTVSAALTAHAEAVAARLRRDGFRGRTVTLKMKLARRRGARPNRLGPGEPGEPIYPVLTRSRTLPRPTDDGQQIRELALALWDAADLAEPVRLLGVSVSGLESRRREQLELFDASGLPLSRASAARRQAPRAPGTPEQPEQPRSRRLGQALDAINERFGKHTIERAVPRPDKLTPSRDKKRGVE